MLAKTKKKIVKMRKLKRGGIKEIVWAYGGQVASHKIWTGSNSGQSKTKT